MNWIRTAGFTSVMATIALTGCGGGNDGTASYTIGGNVAGLGSGKSVVLLNNGNESLDATSNGAFAFKAKIESGKTYDVTVSRQPDGQTCAITNGQGTASNTVTNIQVQCTDVDPGSAACFDNPQLRTQGNSYTVFNSEIGTRFDVVGLTNYHGYSAVETLGGSPRYRFTNVADGMLLDYGSILTNIHSFKIDEAYNVPGRGFPISLTPNQTYTAQGKQIKWASGDTPQTSTWRDTVTYLGREPITTAFGTFETCKMRYTSEVMGEDWRGPYTVFKTWDSWLVGVGKLSGLSVQETTETGTTQPTNIIVSWN